MFRILGSPRCFRPFVYSIFTDFRFIYDIFFFHPQFATLCVFLCFHESLIFGRAFPSAMVEKVASHKAGLAYVIQEFECKLSFLMLFGFGRGATC